MLPQLGDGRLPPQKGAFGLLFSPLLAVFKDMSVFKGKLMKLSNLHLLTSAGKKIYILRQSSRQQVPALLDTLCLPILELQGSRKRLRASLQPVIVAHTFKMGCFALPCHVYTTMAGSFTRKGTSQVISSLLSKWNINLFFIPFLPVDPGK